MQGGSYNALAARARAARPGRRLRPLEGAAVRDERRLPGDRRRGAALLRRQARGADGRGRPAELHRAEHRGHPAPGRRERRAARQGHAAAARASTRAAELLKGARALPRALRARSQPEPIAAPSRRRRR